MKENLITELDKHRDTRIGRQVVYPTTNTTKDVSTFEEKIWDEGKNYK